MNDTTYEYGDIVEYTNIGWHITQGTVETIYTGTKTEKVIKSGDYVYNEPVFIRIIEKANEKSNREKMESVQKTILDGKIYANVDKISASGMSRNLSFFRVNDGKIENVTAVVGWLSGRVKIGEYMQGKSHVRDNGLKVVGCGMDMIFHTLYNSIPSDKKSTWNQNYNRM